MSQNPVTFAVLGIHGYGRNHLAELARLAPTGAVELVAVADPRGADGVDHLGEGVPCFVNLTELLANRVPDVVVLATPINTHAPLAIEAMRAGAHVLLEKPPAASLAEFEEMLAVAEETGRVVQIGFQSFGSHALPEIARLLAEGAIGEVTSIGGVGTWLRDLAYYARSRWAGRRELDGVPVVDGVVTNPLAHCVATALLIAGCRRADQVERVDVELLHAHDIEADDTSSVRVVTTEGQRLAFGLTLCAPTHPGPVVVIHGTEGEIRFEYTADVLHVRRSGEPETSEQLGRSSVVLNLVEHLGDPSVALLAPLVETGAFMRVLEAVRTAPDPAPVDPAYVEWLGEGDGRHPVIADIETWCARVAHEQKLFSELGAPWVSSRQPS